MRNLRLPPSPPFENWLPWLVLLFLLFLASASFVFFPYAGFDFTYDQIVFVYSPEAPGHLLESGDLLVQIGSLRWLDYLNNRWQPVFAGVTPGQIVPIQVEREGRLVEVDWVFPGFRLSQFLSHLMELWWLGFVFWLAGTFAALFIRPRDTVWKLLIAFYYLTAIWLLAGSGPSRWHVLGGAIILRIAAWLFAPVSLQLNWLFPRPLARLPAWFWWLLYGLAIGLAVLEVFSIPPEAAYLVGLALGGAGIGLLLLAHLIFQPAYRKYITPLVIGALIAVLPPLLVVLRDLLGLPSSPTSPGEIMDLGQAAFVYSASMLGIAALPGIYFYSVYMLQTGGPNRRVRRLVRLYLAFIILSALWVLFFAFFFVRVEPDLSTAMVGILLFGMAILISAIGLFPILALPALQPVATVDLSWKHPQLRANRLVSLYLFFILLLAIIVPLVFLEFSRQELPVEVGWISLGLAIVAAGITIFGYPRFQRFVDRRVLGIPLAPTHLLELYSARITTSLELASLVTLLRDELLPSLLVRQSALYQVAAGNLELLYTSGLSVEQSLSQVSLHALYPYAEKLEDGGEVNLQACRCPWVRVLLPLKVEERLVGIWLLGSRDPDDAYEAGEVGVLQAIANQTAIALVNIQQSKRLHALYQADIEREDAERAELALFLHDEVLNPLAALSMRMEAAALSPEVEQAYQELVGNIRQALGGLRPAMLNFGLYPALEELVDELAERSNGGVSTKLDLQPTLVRYEAKAEQHLYRIVEQACVNALQHARPRQLSVSGALQPDEVRLEVRDDGMGMPVGMALNMSQLLLEGHYGLVGMFERAALIGADLKISSSPESGTCIELSWKPDTPRTN